METKAEQQFKAVDFMRQIREELSNLYNTDRKRYFEEIRKAMEEFKARRLQKPSSNLKSPAE
jgi:hypothetical protein